MRSPRIALLALAFLALAPRGAHAVEGCRLWLGPLVGPSFPVGDGAENFKSAITFGGMYEYRITDQVAAGFELAYSNFDAQGVDASISTFQYGGLGRLTLVSGRAEPFLTLGLAFYSVSAKASGLGITVSQSETKPGVNLGTGLAFAINERTRLDLDVRFHNIFTEDSSTQYVAVTPRLMFCVGGGY
jgi:opacity protein-like surface antigen